MHMWWGQLNPRRYLAAAIGWAVFGVVSLAALITANWVANDAERRALDDTQDGLVEFATQARDALAMRIETRIAVMQATAARLFGAAPDRQARRKVLLSVLEQFPEFKWLAVTDDQGRISTEAGNLALATGHAVWDPTPPNAAMWRVSDKRARVGRDAIGVDEAMRVIDLAVPLASDSAESVELLQAALSWGWIEGQLEKMRNALDRETPTQVVLVAADGNILAGPPAWIGRSWDSVGDASQGGRHVVGSQARLRLADGVGLGWTAVVRQEADRALAPVQVVRRTVFLTIVVAGLLSAAVAVGVSLWLARRLGRLAADAEQVQSGRQLALAVPAGVDEVSRIGATMAQLVDHLQREKLALLELNRDLDERVAERTARIERMADEARHVAVTRERLRIARDMHDTLAHSLMALLTQIRLVRKLQPKLAAAELDAELERAETVAGEGLADARMAIRQMRGNSLHDTGLGMALDDLVSRFADRSNVKARLRTDVEAAAWADDRADAVFRIVEEALRNVERHAMATEVDVALDWRGPDRSASSPDDLNSAAEVRVSVTDNGCGFDTALPRPQHFGLLGMQEQSTLIGATLSVLSSPGRGTRVELALRI